MIGFDRPSPFGGIGDRTVFGDGIEPGLPISAQFGGPAVAAGYGNLGRGSDSGSAPA